MDALDAVSVGDAGQLEVCVIEKGNVESWETLRVDLRPVVLWLRMLAFEYVNMFLADAKPYYLQFIT